MRRTTFVLALALAGAACGGDDSTGGGAGSTGQTGGTMSQTGGAGGTSSTGGAAGTSTAGSTMAGGAAGASVGAGGTNGTDAGSKCTVMNQNMCDTCVFAKCCDAYGACNDDPDCMNAIGNLAECVATDSTMVTQCYDDFATTNDMSSALRMCVKTNCDVPCTKATP
jgi:hypothetical protein